jgi:putative endonuclease
LPAHLKLGIHGEILAARYLKREHHFKILYRNFYGRRGGEIDLVCRDQNVLVFVEVKTRTTDLFGAPHGAVNQAKQLQIIKAAKEWLWMLNDEKIVYRFDIVEVVLEPEPQVTLLRGAFSSHVARL